MPIPGLFSAYYWPGDGGSPPPPASGPQNGYPYWFDPSTVSMNFQLPRLPVPRERYWFEKLWKRVQRGGFAIWRLIPRRLQVLWLVSRVLFGPNFRAARKAVDFTSQDPSFRDMTKWNTHLATTIGQDPHIHENVSRFLAAWAQLDPKISRSERSLLVELAYLGRKNG